MVKMGDNLISVNNVSVNFDYQENFISKKQKIHAVNNINIKIKKGSFFGLVGESGSGKTTLGRAILGANKISSGNVIFHDDERDYDLTDMNKQDLKEYRKKAQLIFQDPYAALSPRMTVRDIIAEPLEVMKITNSRQETDERVRDIASKCRLNIEHFLYSVAGSVGSPQNPSSGTTSSTVPVSVIVKATIEYP